MLENVNPDLSDSEFLDDRLVENALDAPTPGFDAPTPATHPDADEDEEDGGHDELAQVGVFAHLRVSPYQQPARQFDERGACGGGEARVE